MKIKLTNNEIKEAIIKYLDGRLYSENIVEVNLLTDLEDNIEIKVNLKGEEKINN